MCDSERPLGGPLLERFGKLVGLVIAASLLLCVLPLSVCGQVFFTHPSNGALAKRFREHRAGFERVVQMANEDSDLVRIAPTFTRLRQDWAWPRGNVGISPQRWDEYRRLFEELDCPDGIDVDEASSNRAVTFYASSIGLAVSGSSKGYLYSPQRPPKPLARSLDAPKAGSARVFFWPLEGDWYLFQDGR